MQYEIPQISDVGYACGWYMVELWDLVAFGGDVTVGYGHSMSWCSI